MSFSSEPSAGGGEIALDGGGAAAAGGGKEKRARGDKKIRALRDELEKLRGEVDRERERYSKVSEGMVASGVTFKMNDKWALNAEEAKYELHVELSMPIDTILLQCDVPIELLESENNAAIVSRTPQAAPGLLATYRCQEPVNRLEMCVRTSEGRYGNLQAYVWPRIQPKMCRAASYPIKPLSLHTRVNVLQGDELPELNSLSIAGPFTLEQVHSRVVACLPEVPASLPGEEASFMFRYAFLDKIIQADYRKGEATFRSDSLTSLSIVKEVVTKEATARKIQIQITVDARDATVWRLLRKIDPRLRYQLSLTNKVKLIDTLKEVRMQEPDVDFLARVRRHPRERGADQKGLKEQPGRLQFLHGIIMDLFVDHAKFKGRTRPARCRSWSACCKLLAGRAPRLFRARDRRPWLRVSAGGGAVCARAARLHEAEQCRDVAT